MGVIFWLFILAAIFWSGFEQAGSSLNIFTAELVNRSAGPSVFLGGIGAIMLTALLAIPLGYYTYKTWNREDIWSVAKTAVVYQYWFTWLGALVIKSSREWMANSCKYVTVNKSFFYRDFCPYFWFYVDMVS